MHFETPIQTLLQEFSNPTPTKVHHFEVQMMEIEEISKQNDSQSNSDPLSAINDFLASGNHFFHNQSQLESITETQPTSPSQDTTQTYLSQFTTKDKVKKRPHLAHNRKRKRQQTSLQKSFRGYWTKNYLPAGKNPHFDWIVKKMGDEFCEQNPQLLQMREKTGITMEDYVILYNMEQIKWIWPEFFEKRVLYREVMYSRALSKSKKVFIKLLYRYKQAFETGEFTHIA